MSPTSSQNLDIGTSPKQMLYNPANMFTDLTVNMHTHIITTSKPGERWGPPSLLTHQGHENMRFEFQKIGVSNFYA